MYQKVFICLFNSLGITSLSLGDPRWGALQSKKLKGLCPFLFGAAAANTFACGQPQNKKKLCDAQLKFFAL